MLQAGVRAAAAKLATSVGADDFAAAQNELLARLQEHQAANAQAYAPLRQAYPITTGVGEAAPVALTAGPLGMLPSMGATMGWNQVLNTAFPPRQGQQ